MFSLVFPADVRLGAGRPLCKKKKTPSLTGHTINGARKSLLVERVLRHPTSGVLRRFPSTCGDGWLSFNWNVSEYLGRQKSTKCRSLVMKPNSATLWIYMLTIESLDHRYLVKNDMQK